jgi:hypothetical protein
MATMDRIRTKEDRGFLERHRAGSIRGFLEGHRAGSIKPANYRYFFIKINKNGIPPYHQFYSKPQLKVP